MAEPIRFRAEAYGYDYTWEVMGPGLLLDAAQRAFVWARPVERHSGKKPGRLRSAHVFHLNSMPPNVSEFFRARVMNPQTTKA